VSEPAHLISEDDLHAFVDGQLGSDRRAALQRYLDANPDAAGRVAAYRAQRAALRTVFIQPDSEALPPRLDLSRILQERQRHRLARWRIAAAIVLALGVGGTGGWFLHQPSAPTRSTLAMQLLEQEAFTSHVVYAADRRHPIEMGASDEAHLKQWLSNRLGQQVAPPDLSSLGFQLIGGRLLATEHGAPAAMFMYNDASGRRLSLLLRPMAPDLKAPWTDIQRVGLSGYAWIAKGMGCAVVAALPETELNHVAAKVWAELGTG
jgi:anti-sigma factor RsiW